MEAKLEKLKTSATALRTAVQVRSGSESPPSLRECAGLIAAFPAGCQEKAVDPTAEGWTVTADMGYEALSKVTVAAVEGLTPENIPRNITIGGVTGTAKPCAVTDGSWPFDGDDDDPVAPPAKNTVDAAVQEKDPNAPVEDYFVLADNEGNITTAYMYGDAFRITWYNPITTEFRAVGWRRVSKHTSGELAGTIEQKDFTTDESDGWNYLCNIRACTRSTLYYNGVEIWPNNYPLTPMFAPSCTWYKGMTAKSSITQINLVDTYSATGTETESWAADVDGDGSVMCYVNGTTLTIAGNGSGRIVANPDSTYMFSDHTIENAYISVERINGLDILDTTAVVSMAFMFSHVHALTQLDLSSFNTCLVRNMDNMFLEARVIKVISLANFNTSSLQRSHGMFNGCFEVVSIDISSFNTSNVINMGYMFNACKVVRQIYVGPGWDTSNADTTDMFRKCAVSSVTQVDFDAKGLILDATGRFVAGSMTPTASASYTGTSSLRLRVGYPECNNIKIPAGTVVTVDLKAYAASNWAMWFVTSAGVAKIKAGGNLTKETDYIDTGWMTSGQTYVIPEDTQFIWLNFRRQDNSSVSLASLYSFVIYAVPEAET